MITKLGQREIESESIPTPVHLRVYRELGHGGMGRVHPATDRNLLRQVALKWLDKELAREPMYRDGFIAEAQITGQLEHPNILPVHELAISNKGIPYFTMKLVGGHRIRQMAAGIPPVDRARENACRTVSTFFSRFVTRWLTPTIAVSSIVT